MGVYGQWRKKHVWNEQGVGVRNHARGCYEIWRVAAFSGITSSTFTLRVCLFALKGIPTLF